MSNAATSMRILHVDDKPNFTDLTAEFLEREDDRFEIEAASSAEDALSRLGEAEFDCIISDFEMPGQNGIEFLRAVREANPDLPFILFTGKGSEEIASDAISAGVSDYLQKTPGTDQYALLANRVKNAIEQYRAEQTHERFQTLVEEATDVMLVVAPDGTISYATPSAEHILGRTPEELEGSNGFEPIHPADVQYVQAAFGDLVEHPAERRTAEFRYELPDGSYIWVEARGRNLLEDPVIGGIVVYARDTTDRKERELELRQQERRYEAIFNDPNILVGLLDIDGSVLDINETAMEYIDAELGELIGRPFWRTPWFADSRAVTGDVKGWIERARGGEYVEFEGDLARSNGDPLSIHGVFRPVRDRDGEVGSLIMSARDVTARKERQEALDNAKSQLEAAVAAGAVGTWEWHVPEDRLVVGREFARTFGVEPDEAREGVPLERFTSSIHEDDRERVEAKIQAALESCGEYGAEYRVYNADSEVRWVVARGEVECDEDGEPVSFPGALIDITERKVAEEELKRQNERLDEFASVVSHDLRNPLTVAEGHLELAREECDSRHLEAIGRSHERMQALIDDLLVLSRGDGSPGETGPVDLADLIGGCWANVDTAGASLDVRVERRFEADERRLQQLFENLFRNAVEHGGDGVTVSVGELEDGFYVEDDGRGIPEGDREAVFASGYSSDPDGTGFGLSIVQQVVDVHDWAIRVTDGEDGGARFEITGIEVSS